MSRIFILFCLFFVANANEEKRGIFDAVTSGIAGVFGGAAGAFAPKGSAVQSCRLNGFCNVPECFQDQGAAASIVGFGGALITGAWKTAGMGEESYKAGCQAAGMYNPALEHQQQQGGNNIYVGAPPIEYVYDPPVHVQQQGYQPQY